MAVKTYKKNSKVQLSANFRAAEFKCKCSNPECSNTLIDPALVDILQNIRDHFGVSVNITSGYRCSKHNKAVGGNSGSHHLQGMAADITVTGIEPVDVARYAESIGVKRIGLYDMEYGYFVHIGSGTTKNFWHNKSANKVKTFIEEAPQTFTVEMTVLKRGMKSDEVKGLQALLIGHGYELVRDGSFGPDTEKAVKDYQRYIWLPQTGIVDEATRKSLMYM